MRKAAAMAARTGGRAVYLRLPTGPEGVCHLARKGRHPPVLSRGERATATQLLHDSYHTYGVACVMCVCVHMLRAVCAKRAAHAVSLLLLAWEKGAFRSPPLSRAKVKGGGVPNPGAWKCICPQKALSQYLHAAIHSREGSLGFALRY